MYSKPKDEKYRVVFHTETGFVNKEVFSSIMDQFKEIVSTTRVHDIHVINIMPGSSHWFQKKKNEILTSTSLPHEQRGGGFFWASFMTQ